MKERPIIFSTEMVRAILDGRKTQTRRVIKSQPNSNDYWQRAKGHLVPIEKVARYCPYGQPSDRLWVRESFGFLIGGTISYRANCDSWHLKHGYTIKWKPSIHMPRWASRIYLEITEVRVERLKAITVIDLVDEGIEPQYEFDTNAYNEPPMFKAFIALWDSLNAKRGYSFETNPWVWVISFKRIEF